MCNKADVTNNIAADADLFSEKIWCLPFNGDIDYALDTAKKHNDVVYEFYGDDGFFSSCRHCQNISCTDLSKLIDGLGRMNVKFNYTLNSPNLEGYLIHEKALLSHLKELKEMGVENITVTHPVFIGILKEMGFSVSASAVQCISSVPQAKQAEYIGFNRILLVEDLNRDIKTIKEITETISIPAEIIINNLCMINCPWRISHYAIDGIRTPEIDIETWNRYNNMMLRCRSQWREDPAIFLRSTWIRPEEIKHYRDLGVRFMKLVGRDWPSDRLEKVFGIYFKQFCDGYVFDYLRPGYDIKEKYGIRNPRNTELDGFFDFFFKNGNSCSGLCEKCGHCESYAKELFYADND